MVATRQSTSVPAPEAALRITAARHGRLCPRQVLGVRIGLAGARALDVAPDSAGRPLLLLAETDGCFVDGLEAATGCSVGHRNLRLADYGKVAATFIDTRNGAGVRVVPRHGVRETAAWYARGESRRYYQQLLGYQQMPDEELLLMVAVEFAGDLQALLARPGVRTNCHACGEEILNDREVHREESVLCRACAGDCYYRLVPPGGARARPISHLNGQT